MMDVVIAAALFLAAAVTAAAFIILPLSRPRRPAAATPSAVDVDARRERLRELDEEHAAGLMDDTAYREARDEAERELLAALEDTQPGAQQAMPERRAHGGIITAAAAVPVLAALVYVASGRPELILGAPEPPSPASERAAALREIEGGLPALRERVAEEPGNIRAWAMLTNAYLTLERPRDAVRTTARALEANGDTPSLLVARARALAAANGDRFGAEARGALKRVLQRAPAHPGALWLSGLAAAQGGDWERARSHWQRLAETLPKGEARRGVEQALASLPGSTSPAGDGDDSVPAGIAKLEVAVSLAPEVAADAPPDTTVFVFAKAADGNGMPLAAARTTLGALPATVALDAAMATASGRSIEPGDALQIVARVSRSGGVKPAPGDWQGSRRIVNGKGGGTPAVTIDERL